MERSNENTARLRAAVITVSDTRTEANDEGGRLLQALLGEAGVEVTRYAIVTDDVGAIRAAVRRACDDDVAEAIVTTGGTGLAPRDVTYEAIDALLEKRLDGFGEAFRRLSWDAIGPRAILSRALAGTMEKRLIVALPGSPAAITLGVRQVLLPVLHHAVAIARGEGTHHGATSHRRAGP